MTHLTTTFGETEDGDGYHRCSRCKSKTMLICAGTQWHVDSEHALAKGSSSPSPSRPTGEEVERELPDGEGWWWEWSSHQVEWLAPQNVKMLKHPERGDGPKLPTAVGGLIGECEQRCQPGRWVRCVPPPAAEARRIVEGAK